ncbi:MAG TPA: phosphoribosylaminoimidazolesuccinocarboxamide synthase [Rubricoccaceae bacterium]|jgi:phosphoribosylaminoimidazole-succinocarboxamide synthase
MPLPPPLVETRLPFAGRRARGKVRDTYATDDGRLVLVTTDRISAFDHVLRQAIPLKGQVLNRLAARVFALTADVAPNAVLSVPDPNVTIALRCDALPVEFVVRGHLAGHAWRVYRSGGREVCGVRLPDGLREGEALPEPVLTPSTKAAEGHDEDISLADIVARGVLSAETLDEVHALALAVFRRGTALARDRGLVLVDTKYEFGRAPDGRLLLIDEVHTPDSSRYYLADGFDARLASGEPQRQLSKEFVREWLIGHGFQGRTGETLPDLPPEFVAEISARYVELYEALTCETFVPDLHPDPEARVQAAVEAALA